MKIFLYIHILAVTLVSPFFLLFGPMKAFQFFQQKKLPNKNRFAVQEIISVADKILLFNIFGRLIFRTRCLKRTLVLYHLLRYYGYNAKAILGFDKENKSIIGHAWLMLDDEKIADPIFTPQREFVPFIEIDSEVRIIKNA